MKYKIGDKVQIKSLDWYNENKDENGVIEFEEFRFVSQMSEFCGKILTIDVDFEDGTYLMKEDIDDRFVFTNEMIEGLVEEIPKFKPDDIVVTNDNLYGYITDDIEYDKDKKSFKYYVSFIVDGGYYYESQLKLSDNKEQMTETNNVCASAIAGNIIAEKDMLSIALSNGLILPKCTNKDLVKMDIGEVSDGYHTFNELYEYRLLYNASFFNELAKQNLYNVHKSKKHSDGEDCFGGGWFIVMAELPTGQVSNHYELKDWHLFQVPEKEKANAWDGHTPQDVAKRMREFLTPKSKYPKTYEECCDVLNICKDMFFATYDDAFLENDGGYLYSNLSLLTQFFKLKICRDAYWKIAGEEMGLGKPWNPLDSDDSEVCYGIFSWAGEIQHDTTAKWCILTFPTEKMRDTFYENFKELINKCKELL